MKKAFLIALIISSSTFYVIAQNTFPPSGNVGIGTTSPASKLDIIGGNLSIYNPSNSTGIAVGSTSFGKTSLLMSTSADSNGYGEISVISASGGAWGNLVLEPNGGNVVIGKTSQANPSYKLDVAGNIRANQITVNNSGADFVFRKGYRLKSLSYLEKYINTNHHLPEIVSADQMSKEGMDLGELNKKLLQKVEELTLYLFEKEKKDNEQQKRIENLEKRLFNLSRTYTNQSSKKK